MSPIKSNLDQFKALAKNPSDSPIVMLNLLKFKEDGGAESYARYAEAADKFVTALGGKSIYVGKAMELLNGEETWDIVMLVQYPSRKAFLKMANDPEYLKIHKFREDGLERAVLYSTEKIGFRELTLKK
ncbi:MAG: DUF1330 domain-containing protein [Syntrophales bacterium]|nr:DUF1330 domain-containing protein [Syntrophales bacterium]MDY0045478.1 DUF1330 domain-containing protein [Syntrophales bacterium]